MDLFVSVAVFAVVLLAVLASYLYVLRVNEKKKVEELAAWQREQSRQRRRAAALKRNHPEKVVKLEPSSQDLVSQVMQSQLASKAGVWVKDNYGRGDV